MAGPVMVEWAARGWGRWNGGARMGAVEWRREGGGGGMAAREWGQLMGGARMGAVEWGLRLF